MPAGILLPSVEELIEKLEFIKPITTIRQRLDAGQLNCYKPFWTIPPFSRNRQKVQTRPLALQQTFRLPYIDPASMKRLRWMADTYADIVPIESTKFLEQVASFMCRWNLWAAEIPDPQRRAKVEASIEQRWEKAYKHAVQEGLEKGQYARVTDSNEKEQAIADRVAQPTEGASAAASISASQIAKQINSSSRKQRGRPRKSDRSSASSAENPSLNISWKAAAVSSTPPPGPQEINKEASKKLVSRKSHFLAASETADGSMADVIKTGVEQQCLTSKMESEPVLEEFQEHTARLGTSDDASGQASDHRVVENQLDNNSGGRVIVDEKRMADASHQIDQTAGEESTVPSGYAQGLEQSAPSRPQEAGEIPVTPQVNHMVNQGYFNKGEKSQKRKYFSSLIDGVPAHDDSVSLTSQSEYKFRRHH